MNSRERALAILLICVIVFGGGGFLGYQFVYVPWNGRHRKLETLKKEENDKLTRLADVEKQRAKLARWTSLSLPGDPDMARLEYEKYLNQLFTRHKITNGREITPRNMDAKSSPTIGPNKEPIYTKLTFTVKTYATLANLVGMMDDFYKMGLMQEIKNLSLQRQMTSTPQTRPDELDVRMTIEALIVSGADKRPYLLPNIDRKLLLAVDVASSLFRHEPFVLWTSASPGLLPPGLLAEPPRDYSAIAKKNIFLGRPPKAASSEEEGTPERMVPRYVYLTDITQTPLRMESMLYDRWNNEKIKLRESSGAYNSFPLVRDGKKIQVVVGRVVRIDDRKLFYQVELEIPVSLGRAPGAARPDKAELEKLVADKVVGADSAKRVVRYEEDYWDTLLRQKVVNVGFSDRNRFTVDLQRNQATPPEDDVEEGAPI